MKSALRFLALSLLITSCSLFENDKEYQFEAVYKKELITGDTQVQNYKPEQLFIRGVENRDFINGRFLTIIVDDYSGEGTYPISNYSFARLVGGDAIVNIGRADEPYGKVVVTQVNNNIVNGEFSGMFISRDSTETFEISAFFEVVRDFE